MESNSNDDGYSSEKLEHWVEIFKDLEWKGGKGMEGQADDESDGKDSNEGEDEGKEGEGDEDGETGSEVEEDGTENKVQWKRSRSDEEVIQKEHGMEGKGEDETKESEIVKENETEEEIHEWNKWVKEIMEGEGTEDETKGDSDENVKVKKAKKIALKTKAIITQAKGKLFYSPGAAADLFIVGWRFWFLMLKTLETALLVSPRSSPYALDLICSLKHLSMPSRYEIHQRLKDNYTLYSGEYFWVLRSLVYLSICRFASPFRILSSIVFISLCGFLPIDDRSFGQYKIKKDFQRIALVIIAVFLSGAIRLLFWCALMVLPFTVLHLVFHNPSSNGSVFGLGS